MFPQSNSEEFEMEIKKTIPFTIASKRIKQIKDINVRPETIKHLEENTEEKFLSIGLGNYVLDITPKAKATKAKLNK